MAAINSLKIRLFGTCRRLQMARLTERRQPRNRPPADIVLAMMF
jgi:hypothetical protein